MPELQATIRMARADDEIVADVFVRREALESGSDRSRFGKESGYYGVSSSPFFWLA